MVWLTRRGSDLFFTCDAEEEVGLLIVLGYNLFIFSNRSAIRRALIVLGGEQYCRYPLCVIAVSDLCEVVVLGDIKVTAYRRGLVQIAVWFQINCINDFTCLIELAV